MFALTVTNHVIITYEIKWLLLFSLLFTSGCFLVSAADVLIAGVATMELLQLLKRFNKKWFFICTIHSIT
jgi:hypothetical protein